MNRVDMQCPSCQYLWFWLSGTPAICPRCHILHPIEVQLHHSQGHHTEKQQEKQVCKVNKGKMTKSRKSLARGSDLSVDEVLTRRECEVLQLVAQGYSNQRVAEQLVISLRTVENHLHNIYSKIYVASRTEATLWVIKSKMTFISKK